MKSKNHLSSIKEATKLLLDLFQFFLFIAITLYVREKEFVHFLTDAVQWLFHSSQPFTLLFFMMSIILN